MKTLFIVLTVVIILYCCSLTLYACCRLADRFGKFDTDIHLLLNKICQTALYVVCLPLAIYRRVKSNVS